MNKQYLRLLGTATSAVTVLALGSVAPAIADPATTPGASTLVGVGSDTTQFMMTNLIDGATVSGKHVAGWNESHPTSPQLASFDACLTPSATAMYPCVNNKDTITLRSADPNGGTYSSADAHIVRPNGSGAGRKLLYGAGNDNYVSFARSSSALDTNAVNAGLQAYPYAVDTLVLVTSKNVATNAPATLTSQQIVGIFNGTITDWSQIGGKAGAIKPMVPQAGSGTRGFFEDQLKALNGGVPVTYGPNVNQTVQEHDPTLIQNDPNAIAPFSLGRANLAGSVQVEQGFDPQRALYNVVRGSVSTDVNGVKTPANWVAGSSDVEAVFGAMGFLCSPQATSLIEQAGFKQMAPVTAGGACGVPTQAAESNLTEVNANGTPSTTSVALSAPTSTYGQTGAVKATVTVSGAGGTPSGNATVSVGSWSGTATLTNGTGTVTLPNNVPAGARAVTAAYNGDTTFASSRGSSTLSIARAGSRTGVLAPRTVLRGRRATITVRSVLVPASVVKARGPVRIQMGRTVIARGYLNWAGAWRITLPRLPRGVRVLYALYSGNGNIKGSAARFVITQR